MSRGIKASTLKNTLCDTLVKQHVGDLSSIVDQEIIVANTAGWATTKVELPTEFIITGIERQDAQLLVYCDLIQLYEKPESEGGKGFRVEFLPGVKPSLVLFWNNGMSEEERARRRDILYSHISEDYLRELKPSEKSSEKSTGRPLERSTARSNQGAIAGRANTKGRKTAGTPADDSDDVTNITGNLTDVDDLPAPASHLPAQHLPAQHLPALHFPERHSTGIPAANRRADMSLTPPSHFNA